MSGGIKLNFSISKAMLNELPEINNMLTDLIQDERKNYDNNINENYTKMKALVLRKHIWEKSCRLIELNKEKRC